MERSRRVEKRHTPHHFGGGGEKRGVKTLEERGRDEKERGTFKFSLYVFAVACLHSLDRVCERAFVSFLLTLTIVVASTPRIVVWGGEGKIKIERASRPRVVKLLVLKKKKKKHMRRCSNITRWFTQPITSCTLVSNVDQPRCMPCNALVASPRRCAQRP